MKNPTPPIKGNPASAQPMPGLSPRAQALLNKPRHNISLVKRYAGEIPNALRSTPKKEAA